jgi:hypothetical protein
MKDLRSRPSPRAVRRDRADADDAGAVAAVALTAFNGAAIGLVASFVAALREDVVLMLVSAIGATACVCVWQHHISDCDISDCG